MRGFARSILRRRLAVLGLALVAAHLAIALAAPLIVPHDPFKLLDAPLEPPGAAYLLGTDELGRDFFSRLIMGGRVAIAAALAAGFLAAFGGGLVGLAAAYYRGLFDDVVSRLVEMKLAIPAILFVSLFVTGFGQTLPVLVFVMAVIKMMGVIRTARAQGLVLMEQGYVKAAILRGERGPVVILREMLPNVADLLSVEFALRSSSAMLLVSALSFLGLGLSPPTPDWGLMIHDGLQSIRSEPWLILAPALCISTLVVGMNFAIEGVADAAGLEAARGTAGH
ncbi:MAG: ABC transporter permease [Alphaproteobacteria bacterium]|nr:ABC transporter permease [Alphaproteobacteria bacterium]